MINTTHKIYTFLNQINGKIPRSDVIDPEIINTHDLCHQCSKHGPNFLFGKSRIKDFNDKPHFPKRIKLVSSKIEMNSLFKTNYERKRSICDKSINKAMRIPVDSHQTNKRLYVTVQQKH